MRLLARARPVAIALMLAPWGILPTPGTPARAATAHTPPHQTVALSPFDRAERLREALEGRPEEQRTRRDYERVLAAFRAIYHDDPASPRADASISTVADLLAEEGRVFQDEKSLRDAIGQYEFLRREYPGSRYRFSALLTEAEIYRHDLNDRASAKTAFQQFLKLYPQNPLADQARQGLKQVRGEEVAEKRTGKPPARERAGTISAQDAAAESGAPPSVPAATPNGKRKSRNTVLTAAVQSQNQQPSASRQDATRQPGPSPSSASASQNQAEAPPTQPKVSAPPQSAPPVQPPPVQPPPVQESVADTRQEPATASEASLNSPPPPRRGRLPLVTGVRHWSTPVYTRVAIAL
jgi:N-acetylmuramoyl-L-alanine amidase